MPKEKRFNKFINFHLDEELLTRLDDFVKRQEYPWNSRNMHIREAIREYLDRREK